MAGEKNPRLERCAIVGAERIASANARQPCQRQMLCRSATLLHWFSAGAFSVNGPLRTLKHNQSRAPQIPVSRITGKVQDSTDGDDTRNPVCVSFFT